MADVWIVVAAYNESRRLPATLHSLCARFPNVVVVDDGSSDRTADVVLSTTAWLLRHPFNCGQGAALRTGIQFALQRGAGVIVTFDADGQHDPAEIERLVAPVSESSADVALGSRFRGEAIGIPWTRRLVLLGGVLFTRLFSGVRVTDAHNGFRAFSREAAQRIDFTQDRMAHASEILDQIRAHHLRFCEVPVTIRYTQESLAKGQSSWNAIKIVAQLLLGRLMR
jgi:glycosyltransferase involved in cell wall biosynthesis